MSDEGRFGTFGEDSDLPRSGSFKHFEEQFGYKPKKPKGDYQPNSINPQSKGYGFKAVSKLSAFDMFSFNLVEVIDEIEDIIMKKQKDYGSAAIMKSPYGPLRDILVRMHDKMSRAVNLEKKISLIGGEPKNESLRDTFIDIAGYSILAILVLDERFPEE